MISLAVRSFARSAVSRPVLSCLPALSSFSLPGRDLHVIAVDAKSLENKSHNISSRREISFNILEKATKKQRIHLSGTLLYEGIADRLNYQYFFDEFQLEDTFFSWFLITELHVWMLMLRVMQEGDDGIKLRNFIVETMWEDVQARSKKLDFHNASLIKKQLQVISEEFNASIVGYDEAVELNDAGLAGHVWRRFFKNEKVSPLLIEKLVHYIRKQLFMLSHVGPAELFNMSPKINWEYV